MKALKWFPRLALAASLAACDDGSGAQFEKRPPASGPDGGPGDVAFTSPAPDVFHTNDDAVTLQLYAFGSEPDEIELWLDDEPFATLEPPYTLEWDTRSETDGPYVFEARAIEDGLIVSTDTVTIHLDRRPPQLVSKAPADFERVAIGAPMTFTYDEPIDPARLTIDEWVQVWIQQSSGIKYVPFTPAVVDDVTVSITRDPEAEPTYGAVSGYVVAHDLAGNMAITQSLNLYHMHLIDVLDGTTLDVETHLIDLDEAADGTLWLLGALPAQTSAWPLVLARWTGTDWEIVTQFVGPSSGFHGRLVLDGNTPVIAIESESFYAWDGSALIAYPPLTPTNGFQDWEAIATAPGELLVGRCNGANEIELWRGGAGGWTAETPIPDAMPSIYGGCEIDLAPTATGVVASYYGDGNRHCTVAELSGGVWTTQLVIPNYCDKVAVERGGDGAPYFLASYGTQFMHVSEVYRHDGTSWVNADFDGLTMTELYPSSTSVYALDTTPGLLITDGATYALDYPYNIRAVVDIDGEPMVLTGAFPNEIGNIFVVNSY